MLAASQNKRKRESRPTRRPYYTEKLQPDRKTVEWKVDEQCGLDQPEMGIGIGKRSVQERIGSDAYNEFLKDRGWSWIPSCDLRCAYIYYFGPRKANKGLVDKLEDGVTKFFGLEELGKSVEKYGRGEVLRRAQLSRAQQLPFGAATATVTTTTTNSVNHQQVGVATANAAVVSAADATDPEGAPTAPTNGVPSIAAALGGSKIDRHRTAPQTHSFQAIARQEAVSAQQRQAPVMTTAQAPTASDADDIGTNNMPSVTVPTNSDPPIAAALGGVSQARPLHHSGPRRPAGQSKTLSLNPSGGLTGGPKASKYEHLGTVAWKTIGGPHGLQYKQVKRDQLHTDQVFHFGLENNKKTIDKLVEGVTKFTGYEALGKCYEEHGSDGILKRAMAAPNSNARLVPLRSAVGNSVRRSENAASSNAGATQAQSASLALGASQAIGSSVASNHAVTAQLQQQPIQRTAALANQHAFSDRFRPASVLAPSSSAPQSSASPADPSMNIAEGNNSNLQEAMVARAPPARAPQEQPAASARNHLFGTETSNMTPMPVSDRKLPALKDAKARFAALEMEIVGSSNGTFSDRLASLEHFVKGKKFHGSADQRVKDLEKWYYGKVDP